MIKHYHYLGFHAKQALWYRPTTVYRSDKENKKLCM